MRQVLPMLLICCAACNHMDHDSAHTHKDGGGEVGEGACFGVSSARVVADGSCLQMQMEVDLVVDAETCAYTLSNWSMDHGDEPTGGQLSEGQATLVGAGLSGCVGLIADGAIEGICDDGCTWSFDAAR